MLTISQTAIYALFQAAVVGNEGLVKSCK